MCNWIKTKTNNNHKNLRINANYVFQMNEKFDGFFFFPYFWIFNLFFFCYFHIFWFLFVVQLFQSNPRNRSKWLILNRRLKLRKKCVEIWWIDEIGVSKPKLFFSLNEIMSFSRIIWDNTNVPPRTLLRYTSLTGREMA